MIQETKMYRNFLSKKDIIKISNDEFKYKDVLISIFKSNQKYYACLNDIQMDLSYTKTSALYWAIKEIDSYLINIL